ncbi:MAG: IS701 family transposase [Thiocapsa sp.]|uniref:IS701 family transposase n=1 Tax=Thiocapsa sp. TaxID=2024551 RepID=UPI001BCB2835|nr:IS701 family transposase [Thiocapsa sp.]QVL46984.1 MAG: IS701 family transposase [Thiocapsa sp.]
MIEPVGHYLRGLIQADPNKKNMERMEERVPDADEQQLQQMLTDSPWDHQAVIDQVALAADRWLGGHPNSCLLIDESGFKKSGKHSVGVARQWCGRLGKVDNCQVGVFAALGRDRRVTLVDERLYLPEKWCDDAPRCEQAGIPEEDRVFKTKVALALAMVAHQRRIGVRFSRVGADGFYGNDPAFLRALAAMGEVFVADVHCNQLIFLEDPKPTVKQKKGQRGRTPTKLEANAAAIRVDQWQAEQPAEAWQRVKVRDSTRGELEVAVLHRRVWLWDNEETAAHGWHLIVRREINAPEEIKYTLSNAPAETPVKRLAEMQAQRYWVERAFQDGKSECGMADYQVRKWSAWHHHMALVLMAMLFMLEERLRAADVHPLLSCSDIEELLKQFLPRRAVTQEDVLAQMEKRHKKRLASIRAQYAKPGLALLE